MLPRVALCTRAGPSLPQARLCIAHLLRPLNLAILLSIEHACRHFLYRGSVNQCSVSSLLSLDNRTALALRLLTLTALLALSPRLPQRADVTSYDDGTPLGVNAAPSV